MEYYNNIASSYFPEKVQAEIDRVLGQSQKVSTAARESMPYTNAVIHEVQRMGNIVPMNVPRELTEDTTLNGYRLVKVIRGSLTASDLQACFFFSLILSFFKLLLFLQFSFTFLRSQLLTSSPSHTQGSNCPEFCVNHSLTFIFNFIIYGYIINNNLVLLVFELQIKKSYQRVIVLSGTYMISLD